MGDGGQYDTDGIPRSRTLGGGGLTSGGTDTKSGS